MSLCLSIHMYIYIYSLNICNSFFINSIQLSNLMVSALLQSVHTSSRVDYCYPPGTVEMTKD